MGVCCRRWGHWVMNHDMTVRLLLEKGVDVNVQRGRMECAA